MEIASTIDLADRAALSPAEAAQQVLARTAALWDVRPESPRAIARRAPRGYVPARVGRRLRASATGHHADGGACLLFGHSW